MDTKTQFIKGCARTLVLKVLKEQPRYGYEIAAELARRSDDIFKLGQGTLYPMLYSLEKKKLICVHKEVIDPDNGRKRLYYALTEQGQQSLESALSIWEEIQRGMALVLTPANA